METTLQNNKGIRIGRVVNTEKRVEISLGKNEILKLEGDQRGILLISSNGTFWVTQEGDVKDHLVEAGKGFMVNRKGKILIQGQPEGRLQIYMKSRLS